ncbi:MAG TPA: outer membrane beta-barrel protein [Rhodanobacteraceae bacterium]|jgi:opacity protein-like surface antigen|nr:outer membrane beta-barrel protein [Rhodanobacteraceae bacterium]
MRKTAIVLATAAVFAAAPVFAQDTTPGADSGAFINGNIGPTNIKHGINSGNDTGYAINGGYRWEVAPNFAVGPEIGYNDLGNVDVKNVFNSQPVISPGHASLHGWTFGGNAKYSFTPNWYGSFRAGLYEWSGHGMSNDIDPVDTHRNSQGWYGGVGVGYDFTRHFGVGIGYDYYHADKDNLNLTTDMVSAQAEYRF